MTSAQERAKHALVVEDERDYAALIATMLREADLKVTVAYDGDEALSRVREQVPDLITLDIQMPRKGGIMFYRQLKSKAEFREIPVIVITGLTRGDRDMSTFIHTFLERDHLPHPEAYLEKPIEQESLLRVAADVLGCGSPG